jgi:anti-anti-sigma regulatory factor
MIDSIVHHVVIDVERTAGNEFVCVRISGEVGVDSCLVLSEALRQLSGMRCENVCVDLAGVGFADTPLLGFLVRVINTVPPDRPVLLCRPSRVMRQLMQLSFLDTIATVCDELPAQCSDDQCSDDQILG